MSAQTVENPTIAAVPVRRPFLRVVRDPRRPAPRLPFVLLVVGILGVTLVGLLLLNTQRAQASFHATALARQVAQLSDQQQQLRRQVEQDQTPGSLAARAQALGMVPESAPGFLGSDGKVVGAVPSGAPVPAAGATAAGGIVVASGSPAAQGNPTGTTTKPKAATKPAAKPTATPTARPTATPTSKPTTQGTRSGTTSTTGPSAQPTGGSHR